MISATNKRLEELVEKGEFRNDLYYRLKVVTIELPPLRDRREDIAPLVDHFRKSFGKKSGRTVKMPTPEVMRRFFAYDWPGNVRELRNVIERAAVLAAGPEIFESDLSLDGDLEEVASESPDLDIPFSEAKKQTVERFERRYIQEALREHEGNVSRTANAIGMVRQSLQQKIRELGLKADEFRKRR